MFDKDSVTVQMWVTAIQSKSKALEDVPALLNLREAVREALAIGEQDE